MNLENLLMWSVGGVAGLSITGFFYLLKLIGNIEDRMDTAIQMKKDFDEVVKLLHEIRDALLGTYDKKGLITKHYELEERVKKIQDIINVK